MHDIDHQFADHEHLDSKEDGDVGPDQRFTDFIYRHDNVELTTIGVDVGSSTFHLMFARVHLRRETKELSSKFEVVEREVIWRSEICLTPYAGRRIDAEAVRAFVADCHDRAGLTREEVDSGAVILTGEALRQHNARALADAIAEGSGKFVCVSAGHHLEAMLAAYGSGAVTYSRDNGLRLLHIDIGGGTTKLALVDSGEVLATAAVMIGGRQITYDPSRHVVARSAGSTTVARHAGATVAVGAKLDISDEAAFVDAQLEVLVDLANRSHSNQLERELRLTRVLPRGFSPDAVSFSGGVSEYIYGREDRLYGDLGPGLGVAMRDAIAAKRIGLEVVDPGEGIRATVAGASQCSVQLSGATVRVTEPDLLPLHNVPVVHPDLAGRFGADRLESGVVSAAILTALSDYGVGVAAPLALAFRWRGDPSFQRLDAFARGVAEALESDRGAPAVILFDQDIGASVGRLLVEEYPLGRPLICLDGLALSPLDFVDVGRVIEPSGALPVVIKSLLFGSQR